MMALKEMLPNNSFVDEEGEIHDFEDVREELDSRPISDASIVQGMANLEAWRRKQAHAKELEHEAEEDAKHMREQVVIDAGLENAGVYETLEEHRKTQLVLADVAGLIAQYEGGEKAGYETEDFQERYKPHAAHVEAGARVNHKKLVNHVLPKLFKADELEAIGIPRYDIEDEMNKMRYKLKKEYGRGKKKAREQWRKQNK